MKITRFVIQADLFKMARLGALYENNMTIDLAEAYTQFLMENKDCTSEAANRLTESLLPADLTSLLQNGQLSKQALNDAYTYATSKKVDEQKYFYKSEEIKLLAPIHNPPNLRDFLSFEEHIKNARKRRGAEVPEEWYEIPVYYKGSTSSIIGHEDDVIWPVYTEKLDYELEFACVIGKEGENIPVEEADKYIAGYMIMNDFSARDIQVKEMKVGLGPAKSKDFATAFGPFFVTKDEINDPYNLKMIARVNGEVWSEGNTGTMFRRFPEIISYVSQNERLVPGDIIGSGTVGLGCGLELGKFLQPNDIVELEIEELGLLRNKIVRKH